MTNNVASAVKKPQLTRVTSESQLLGAVNNLTAAMQLFAGQNSDKLERAVTFKDLKRSGFAIDGLSTDGGSITPPITGGDDPDVSTPPPMSGVHFETTLTNVLAFWDAAGYKRHAYVEVWLAAGVKQIDGIDVPTVLADAHFYGTCPTTAIAIPVPPGDSIRVWLRNVGQNTLTGPWHDIAGTMVTVPENPSYLLDKISGEIRETHLYADLGSKIDNSAQKVIEHGVSLIAHTQELDLHGSQLLVHSAALARDYETLVSHSDTISAQGSYISTLQSVVTGHGNTIATHETSLNNQAASISSIMQINSAQDVTIASYGQTLNSHGTSISNLSQIVNDHGGTLATHSTSINSLNASVVSISQVNETQDATIASHATLLNSHGTSISNLSQITNDHGGTLATHSTSINSLNASVTSISQVNETQDTTIASHATLLNSHGTSISNLSQIVNSHDGTLATYGSSITALNSSVTSLSQVNETQNNTLASHTNSINSFGTSIQSLSSITTEHGALLDASYTLRIDTGGAVHGFGLAVDGTTNRSDFLIRADRFAIAAPQQYDVNGKPIVQTAAFPFIVDVADPNNPKVLIKNAYISNAYIESLIAGKVNADYINAMNLSAVTISGGTITIGNNFSVDAYGTMTCANGIFKGTAQSSNFALGVAGWRLLNTGDAELNNAVVRGTVYANAGWFKGTVYAEKLVGGVFSRVDYYNPNKPITETSAELTGNTVKVTRGMPIQRALELRGTFAWVAATATQATGSDGGDVTVAVTVSVRLYRLSALLDSFSVTYSATKIVSGGTAIANLAVPVTGKLRVIVPPDSAAHEFTVKAAVTGVTGGASRSASLGFVSTEFFSADLFITNGDLA